MEMMRVISRQDQELPKLPLLICLARCRHWRSKIESLGGTPETSGATPLASTSTPGGVSQAPDEVDDNVMDTEITESNIKSEPQDSAAMELGEAEEYGELWGGKRPKTKLNLQPGTITFPADKAYLDDFFLYELGGLKPVSWPNNWTGEDLIPGIVVRGASYADELKGWLDTGARADTEVMGSLTCC